MEALDLEKIDEILLKYRLQKTKIIGILQDVQAEYNYLPQPGLVHIAERLDIPLSQIYGLATFYRAFSLKPRGKHLITVCLGTACHVKGGARIAEDLSRNLNIIVGETTKDGLFTLETVNCLGACALGPIVVIDGKYYRHMNSSRTSSLLKKLSGK